MEGAGTGTTYLQQAASPRRTVPFSLGLTLAMTLALSACSVRNTALRASADLFESTSVAYAQDDDPILIAEMSPFGLKLLDALLLKNPDDEKLLLAAARGYSQYAFGFVQQKGEMLEDRELDAAKELYERARKLYRRAAEYGWRGLDLRHARLQERLHKDKARTLKKLESDDVPLMYWTAVSLGALINLSKDSAELVAQVLLVEALMDRALALDADFNHGAIHQFLIGYELNRRQRIGEPGQRAREHFHRSVQLTQGRQAASFVILAETVMVREQNAEEFTRLLNTALKVDSDAMPAWRLANLLWQQRARWLLERKDQLFTD